ncbi:two-component system, chemotaxis family, response regulator CheY [Marinospirillum celere]|uniref:Two-component system, chemotaxis family, response regulator CheY n=1 Tax=Marinospirillum celere TaxID=1122252 RepID=A0A1I1FS55_9GAMM|nr:response regulator [Marinospirillum celere]SFC00478.1 two-component system, chemotaxis family, response regulator CheY [Marinospirillum celere]
MKILVVDDAQTVRGYHRQLLEQAGFEVDEAANGLEAVEKVFQKPKDYLALLVDINMPQMDGYTLVREVRSNPETQAMIMIMISTESEIHDREMAYKAGANGYLVKPVKGDLLARQLKLVTGRTEEANHG